MRGSSDQLPANTLPDNVRKGINDLLIKTIGTGILISDFKIIAGGCINNGGTIQTPAGSFFVKWNSAQHFPKMFDTESLGLSLLRSSNAIRVPRVIATDETDGIQFIILEFIRTERKTNTFWSDFGHQLAALHQNTNARFGLDHDNYIGSLRQPNKPNASWVDFFIEQRLSYQLMIAEKAGLTSHELRKKFDALFKRLPELFPTEQPSLIHGDLWSGNLIADEFGKPCLIDPAVYFGNKEIEMAYTELFGGFESDFYSAYYEIIPKQSGFKERAEIYNLYPLLVHTNLFGQTYLSQVEAILSRFD